MKRELKLKDIPTLSTSPQRGSKLIWVQLVAEDGKNQEYLLKLLFSILFSS